MVVSRWEFGRWSDFTITEFWEMKWLYHGGSLGDGVTLSWSKFGSWSGVIMVDV